MGKCNNILAVVDGKDLKCGDKLFGEKRYCFFCQSKDKANTNCTKKELKGCGEYFQHGVGEFICGGALYVDGKKKLCDNCTLSGQEKKA